MKKLISLFLVLFIVLILAFYVQLGDNTIVKAQGEDSYYEDSFYFFYVDDKAMYTEDSPLVKTSDFVNTTETEITVENVIDHALNECKVPHNQVSVAVDNTEQVWKVTFYTAGMAGGGQTIYMDFTGKTLMTVLSE